MTVNGVSQITHEEVNPSSPFLIIDQDLPNNCDNICCEIAFFDVNDLPIDALTTFISTSIVASDDMA